MESTVNGGKSTAELKSNSQSPASVSDKKLDSESSTTPTKVEPMESVSNESKKSQQKSESDENEPTSPAAHGSHSQVYSAHAADANIGQVTSTDGNLVVSTTCSYEIKWSNHADVLQNMFRKILGSHEFSDVTLACEGESIKCHRVMLAACSPHFAKLLGGNQDHKIVIYMNNMKIWELKAVVNFMYNGQVTLQAEQLQDFMKVAEALNISGLNDAETNEEPSEGLAEAKTESESLITLKRICPVPALNSHAQSNCGIHGGMNRKALLGNIQGRPPKLMKMQQPSHAANSSGMRSSAWRGGAMVGRNGTMQQQQLGQIVRYENEDYQDVYELYQADMDSDNQGLRAGGNEGAMGSGQRDDQDQLEREDNDDEELEDERELQQYEGEEDGSPFTDHRGMNVYDRESNQGDEQFEYDEEPTNGDVDDEGEGGMQDMTATLTRMRRTYGPEVRDAAFDALRQGVSIRHCSEVFGISRKALAKWKHQNLHLKPTPKEKAQVLDINLPPKKRGPPLGSSLTGEERMERDSRLQKATKMAMTGVTVRQAAAHFDVPRTTLCAYMKRRGLSSQFPFQQQQKISTAATAIALSRSSTTGGNFRIMNKNSAAGYDRRLQQMVAVDEMGNDGGNGEEGQNPFFGLTDFMDQNSDNFDAAAD